MSRTRWAVVLALVVIAAVVLGAVGATGAADGGDSSGAGAVAGPPADALFQTDIDADTIEMVATVGPDGDADWRVTYRLDLEDDADVQAFEELQADIEANRSAYLGPFEERIRRTAGSAENATGREMAVGNVSLTSERTAQPDAQFGEVVFAFAWTGFASVDGEAVRAGDAVDSLFLDEGTSLTFRWNGSLRLDSHTPQVDAADGRLTWRGPREFEAGEPRATLVSPSASGADALPTVPALLAALVAAAGVAVAVYLKRRDEPPEGTAGEGETGPDSVTQDPPSELLSNEERVLALVEDNGGRIKQKEVAETLDWSAAMTSQVVGDLREEGRIETFRIGRENVLTLPDVDIVPDQDEEADDGSDAGGG